MRKIEKDDELEEKIQKEITQGVEKQGISKNKIKKFKESEDRGVELLVHTKTDQVKQENGGGLTLRR